MSKTIEIASYPKCGNTWMRQLIANTFNLDVNLGVPDIHQQKDKTRELMTKVKLDDEIYFYKSHVLDNKLMNPDMIIYIYRHPLDVFFSSMNYFYIRNNKNRFLNNEIKSVEQIFKEGEMGHYFSEFNDDLGLDFYKGLLGEASNYAVYVEKAMGNPKVISVKYEDLVENPENTYSTLISKLFPNEEVKVDSGLFEKVDDLTKNSKKSFFWKANKETYKEFLTNEQIALFYDTHRELLTKLRYC